MAVLQETSPVQFVSLWTRLKNNRNALGFVFMLPAAVILLVFLTYP